MKKVRTIRENAEQIMKGNMNFANGQIQVRSIGSNDSKQELYTLRTYIEHEAKANPNFFRWLFNDYSITFFGTSLTSDQKEEYAEWLHDL